MTTCGITVLKFRVITFQALWLVDKQRPDIEIEKASQTSVLVTLRTTQQGSEIIFEETDGTWPEPVPPRRVAAKLS